MITEIVSRVRHTLVRVTILAAMAWTTMAAVATEPAHARCITVGIDSIYHTQCDLP